MKVQVLKVNEERNLQDLKLEFDPGEVDLQLIEDSDADEGNIKEKKAKICLLKAGWNANDYYFSEESLSEVLSLMSDRPKLYVDHDYYMMGRSEKDWAASYTKQWKEGNGLYGNITFTSNPTTIWFYDEIVKNPKNVQFSIDIRASISELKTPDGREGRKIEKVVLYRSTDIVSYAAAGGEALSVLNQVMENKLEHINSFINKFNLENHSMKKTLMEMRTENPDLVAEIELEVKNSLQNKNQLLDLQNSVESLKLEKETLSGKVSSLETQITDLKNSSVTLTQERDALKLKVDNFEAADRLVKWENQVTLAITESKIDSRLLSEVFLSDLKKETDIEVVKSKIEDRKNISNNVQTILNGGPIVEKKSDNTTISEEDLVNGFKS